MKLKEVIIIVKRLYREYIKKYLGRILIALILSVVVAGSTSSIAWLLDPAVKKIFIDQDKTYAIFIPILVVLAFAGKGISLYYARLIVIVLGSIISGIATVNQAGAIGAAGAIVMAGYRLHSNSRGAFYPALLLIMSLI